MRTYKIKAIYLEVTSKCNLHCPHCYNDSNQKNNEEMDKNKISRIIEQCRINEVENISFSGGEPFLWDSLLYSLNKAKESNFSSISIVSNGTIVTNNLIKSILDIVERESFFVQLSLDGSSPKEHDAIRGIGAYDKLLKTVAILYQNNINYYFHSVLHNRNYNSIKNMIALAKN